MRLPRLLTVAATLGVFLLAGTSTASAAPVAKVHTSQQTTTHVVPAGSVTPKSTTDGTQWAKPGDPTDAQIHGDLICNDGDEVSACFERHGDLIWVWDAEKDLVVRAHWSNWLWDGSSWVFWRNGDCKISWHGWGYCNKDFYEDSSTNAYGSRGSGVRMYACNWDCRFGYKWVRNNK